MKKETAFTVKTCERLVLEYHAPTTEFAKENAAFESILHYVGKEL